MEDEDSSYIIDDQYQDNRSTLNEPTERETYLIKQQYG